MERKSKRNLILAIVGIIIVFFLLFNFGISMLANFSLYISQIGKKADSTKTNQDTYVAPPVLNPLPSATNSASIVISGNAYKGQTILLYINDEEVGDQLVDSDGTFSFRETLKEGKNEISVKAKEEKNESEFSITETVIYQNKSPELTIDSPSDGQKFGKGDESIQVNGKTDPDTDVTVNGFWAVTDENNHYSYSLRLKDGENTITVVATNIAGNKTEKSVKVNYSQ